MTGASVAVVGAGVMGASVAYHLAVRGARDVVLLDRSAGPGLGSTGAATGGFRAQFATPINVRLSLLAREKLRRFREEVGVDPGYATAGYLWLASNDAERAALASAHRIQQAEGLSEAAIVGTDEIARLSPAARLEGVVGGAYCPTDGFIRPREILSGYLAAAERLGARVEWDVEVTGFVRGGGERITGVETSTGRIAAGAVVNAAGAWAAAVAAHAGVELPVTPLRRQAAATTVTDLLPENTPMTIFARDGFHFRVRDGRVLLLQPTPGVPGNPFDASVDPDWVDAVVRTAHERVPVLRRASIDRNACWAGLYEMSPDKHAILGPAPGCENFYLINGSSGHGVMHAPALGQLLAEFILDGAASALDVAALRPSRFAEGEANPVSGAL
jgi:glycine/D-amino acid oxidase-like deaminating enzyme